jgi:hypothetical protein
MQINRSGGPQTVDGKARSSRNAIKHGITSNKMFVLQNENPEAWAEMLDMCIEQFRPVTRYEHSIVEEIAFAKWRLKRLWIIENTLHDVEMDNQAEEFAEAYEQADEAVRRTLAYRSLADTSNTLQLLHRHQTRLERARDRAVKSLMDLRANTPAAAPNPVETENAKRTARSAAVSSLHPEQVTPRRTSVVPASLPDSNPPLNHADDKALILPDGMLANVDAGQRLRRGTQGHIIPIQHQDLG